MERKGEEVSVSTNEARGGSNEGVVRWVLLIGTALTIVALSVIWMTGAATQGDVESEATASGRMEASGATETGLGVDDTDGLVGNRVDEIDEGSDIETPAQTIDN